MANKLRKVVATGVAVLGFSALAVGPAAANNWSGHISGPGGRTTGKIKEHSTAGAYHATVNLTNTDTKNDGSCSQTRIIFDIIKFPDRSTDGPRACGTKKSRRWKGDIAGPSTTDGIKLQQCRVHSDGSGRHCETKAYVDSDMHPGDDLRGS